MDLANNDLKLGDLALQRLPHVTADQLVPPYLSIIIMIMIMIISS